MLFDPCSVYVFILLGLHRHPDRGTTFGRRVYAVGGNIEAARLSGIRVGTVHVAAFVFRALLGLAGLLRRSRPAPAQSTLATGMELSAIAAAVIGGMSILGGEGRSGGAWSAPSS